MANMALLPIRELQTSKARLGPALDSVNRALLSKAMLLDTLEAVTSSQVFQKVILLTPEPVIWSSLVPHGVEVEKATVRGLNESIQGDVEGRGWKDGDSLSVILSDLPASTSNDFSSLADELGRKGRVVVVPDKRMSGTNLLAGHPRFTVPSWFGPDSLRRHVDAALGRGATPLLLCREGLMCDVDTIQELLDLHAEQRLGPRTSDFVRENVHT